jgi:tyrosinase
MDNILNTLTLPSTTAQGSTTTSPQPPPPTPVNLPYAITGIPTEPGRKGEVPLRQECDAWTKSKSQVDLDQRNLFILALRFYVDMDPLDRDSYWQTAGIHGMPYMPWNESTLPQSVPVLGYCTHNSSLFPSWHRPYVALFEQRIYEIMVNEIIPNQMATDKQDSLKAAAKAWRLPYWDWAVNNEVPLLAQNESIEVSTKLGTAKIKNPLYQYDLPKGKTFGTMGPASNQTYVLISADGVPWELPAATGRCPPTFSSDATAFQAGTVNNAQVAENIRNHDWYSKTSDDPTLKESVYRLLTYDVDYEVFATTNMDPSDADPLGYLNCEYIHNNVHNWVGGDAGQMGDVPVAAYDPIFFLHHCNIDRLYAIWQTLYPKKWFRPAKILRDNGTWSIPTGRPDTQCTQLAPFRPNVSGTYYTPDTVRDWMQFGYSYPELQPWNYKTTEDYLLSVYTAIAKLYRVTANSILDSFPKSQDAWGGLVRNHPDLGKDIIVHHDYVINVRYGKYDLGGLPYKIRLYLRRQYSPRQGPIPTRSTPLDLIPPPSLDETSFIGSVYNFSTATGPQGTNTNCPNCAVQQAKETLSTAQIPITSLLVKVAEGDSWSVDTIAPEGENGMVKFLEGRLTWKVFKKGGEEVPLTSLPNLRVSVAVGTATHEKHFDHRPSIYEGYETKHSITHGYLGGLQHDERY